MEHVIASTFITCLLSFVLLPVIGYSWSKHRYPLYTPSYLGCLFCGIIVVGAIAIVLLAFYALIWSIDIVSR